MLIDLRSLWERDGPSVSTTSAGGAVRLIVRSPVPPPRVFTDTDELGLTVAFAIDDDGTMPGQPWPLARYAAPLLDSDEDHAGLLGGLRIDEDYPWAAQYLQLLANRQPLQETDEWPFIAATIVDDDPWQPPYLHLLPSSRLVVLSADEDHAGLLGGLRVDDDYWQEPSVRPLWANRLPFTDDDVFFIPPGVFFLDDELWRHPGIQVLPTSRLVFSSPDDEHAGVLGGFRLDEDYWQRPVSLLLTVNRQPVLDTDERSVALLWLEDELWRHPGIQSLPRSQLVWAVSDEDHAAQLGGLRVEDEYWRLPGVLWLPWNCQPIGEVEVAIQTAPGIVILLNVVERTAFFATAEPRDGRFATTLVREADLTARRDREARF